MRERHAKISQPVDIVDAVAGDRERFAYLPTHTLAVDTDRPMDALLAEAVRYVGSGRRYPETQGSAHKHE